MKMRHDPLASTSFDVTPLDTYDVHFLSLHYRIGVLAKLGNYYLVMLLHEDRQ